MARGWTTGARPSCQRVQLGDATSNICSLQHVLLGFWGFVTSWEENLT